MWWHAAQSVWTPRNCAERWRFLQNRQPLRWGFVVELGLVPRQRHLRNRQALARGVAGQELKVLANSHNIGEHFLQG